MSVAAIKRGNGKVRWVVDQSQLRRIGRREKGDLSVGSGGTFHHAGGSFALEERLSKGTWYSALYHGLVTW